MEGNVFCPHRNIEQVDPKMLVLIDRLETLCGWKFHINRGVYCPECNDRVGGAKHSAHMIESHASKTGKAMDISVSNGHERFLIVRNALYLGVKRIEDRDSWCHVDLGEQDDGFPQETMF